jgi:hypothetical protein
MGLRVLQEESEQLKKLLEEAFPGSKKDTWSYDDLLSEVDASQKAWADKKRLGRGKPQELFHRLMKNLNAHSDLLKLLPEGDKYTSILTGSLTAMIKVGLLY